MNSCQFIGRLGHDVSLRYTTSEEAVGRFSLALDRGKDKGTDWIECVAFGRTAETINRFFHKGSRIGINCHVKSGSYEDKDGNKRKTLDFIVDRFDFVDEKRMEEKAEEQVEGFTAMNEEPPF